MEQPSSPTNLSLSKKGKPRNTNNNKSASLLFLSPGEILTAPPIIRTSNTDGTVTLSARSLSPEPRSHKRHNSKGSPDNKTRPTAEQREQRENTYINIGPTKALLFSKVENEQLTYNMSIVSRPEEQVKISSAFAEFPLKYFLQDYFEFTNDHFAVYDILEDLITDDNPTGKSNRDKLRKEFPLLDKQLYNDDTQDHLKECINGQKDTLGNKCYIASLTYGPAPEPECFFQRIFSILNNLLTDAYLISHYPCLPTDILLTYKTDLSQVRHIWQIRWDQPYVTRLDFPQPQPYTTIAEASIEISTSPQQDLELQIFIGRRPRPNATSCSPQEHQPAVFGDNMDLDEIPPPTDPHTAQTTKFLTGSQGFFSDMLRFSNISSNIDTPLVADALSSFAITLDTREYKLSHFLSAELISQDLIRNRPSITNKTHKSNGIPYSINVRIDRLEVWDHIPRLHSFKIKDGLRQCIVYAQFLTTQEALVCQQQNACNFITLRGLECGWDPLDNLSFNGVLDALNLVLNTPFALIRSANMHLYTITVENGHDKARYRQEPVLIVIADQSLHHQMTQQLFAVIKRQKNLNKPTWSSSARNISAAFSSEYPAYCSLSPHFSFEASFSQHALIFPVPTTRVLQLTETGFFNYINLPKITETATAFSQRLATQDVTAQWVMPFTHDDSSDDTSILDRVAPNKKSAGMMWGTLVQHGAQVISTENSTFTSVTSCQYNPIWLTDRYEFFLGSAIQRLELANRLPPAPLHLSFKYVHGQRINQFYKYMCGVPDTHSSEIFPRPPNNRSFSHIPQPVSFRGASNVTSRVPRNDSQVQHHAATSTSTDLIRREIMSEMETKINAQISSQFQHFQSHLITQQAEQFSVLQQFIAQQTITNSLFMAELRERNANKTTTEEDI